jgi:basic membrane lipoprotein Med (substrate-binding protein (PBP1-ABC) superfamily)
VLWDFSKVFKAAVADVNKGTYGTHTYTLGLNNGVSLLQTKYIPGPVWKLIQKTRKGIIGGSIKVPLTPDLKSVKALMK